MVMGEWFLFRRVHPAAGWDSAGSAGAMRLEAPTFSLLWEGWMRLTREFRAVQNQRLTRLIAIGVLLTSASWLMPLRLGVVTGQSMFPTMHPGQPFIFERVPGGSGAVPGEMVVVRIAGETCIKWLAARGGELLYNVSGAPTRTDTFLITKKVLPAWQRRFPRCVFRPVLVPRDRVYVMGTNDSSLDSRTVGPLPRTAILGRVVAPIPAASPLSLLIMDAPPLPRPVGAITPWRT